MDYSDMSTPQLQAECKRRGLPSGRVKTELVDRLTEDDAAGESDRDFADVEMTVEPEPERVVHEVWPQPERTTPEPAAPPSPAPVIPDPAPGLPPGVFRRTFPAGHEGPNDDQHTRFRAETRQAAADAGLVPRGDAHRVGTVDGCEVYEVSVRQVT